MCYIVIADHPFYPEIEYAVNQQEAEVIRKQFLLDLSSENGQHECKVIVARIIYDTEIKCNY